MANTREIVTKAVIGKGKKLFTTTNKAKPEEIPTTILGCWVINHNFTGSKVGDIVTIQGSYDVNIWYSYDHDTKTNVLREQNRYQEIVNIKPRETNDLDTTNEDIIIRSLKQPSCVKVEIENDEIKYTVEKELGIELIGDVKVKIETSEEEDLWDEIVDSREIDAKIEEEVEENFISESDNSEDKEVL